MVSETSTYTGNRVGQDVKDKFGDTGGVQITDPMILRWVNDGIRSISALNSFLKLNASANLVAGTATYSLAGIAPRIDSIDSIVVNGNPIKMVTFGQYQLAIVGELDDPTLIGTDQGGPVYGTLYGDTLTLWPVPNVSVTNGIVVYFTGYPAEVTDLAAVLPIPDRFQNALRDYVLAQALELDENWEASQIKLQHHEADMQRQFEREGRSPTNFYPTITQVEDGDYLDPHGVEISW